MKNMFVTFIVLIAIFLTPAVPVVQAVEGNQNQQNLADNPAYNETIQEIQAGVARDVYSRISGEKPCPSISRHREYIKKKRGFHRQQLLDIKPDCPQLFVDDYLIDSMSNIKPSMHQPQKVSPKEGKKPHSKRSPEGEPPTPQELGHYSFPKGMQFSPDDIPGLFDPRTPTKKPVHIRFTWGVTKEGYGLHREVSYDGESWGPKQLVWPRVNDGPGECHCMFWVYKKQCLIDTVRMGSNYPHGRTVGRSESYDFGMHWTPPVRILTEDELDPGDYQVYNAKSGIYAGIYLSFIQIFATDTGHCFPMLATSRDGYHYNRFFREPFIPLGPEGIRQMAGRLR